MKLFIDVETIPTPIEDRLFLKPDNNNIKYGNATKEDTKKKILEEAIKNFEEGTDCASSALTGKVTLIGYAINETPIEFLDNDSERILLHNFWETVNKNNIECIIGHNITEFDIPFLIRRSWLHGIFNNAWIISELTKYTTNKILDTNKAWLFNKRHEYISLKNLCGFFGVSMKDSEVNKKDFYKFWTQDKEKCKDYCKQQIEATRKIYNIITD